MASNSWLTYKRDTRYLLKWIVEKSNSILKSLGTREEDAPQLNTTGAIRISELVFISRFISRHLEKVPSIVFRLFKYVIAARVAYHDVFQAMLAKGPDLELEKSNQSHKYVIDAFKQAFDVLGGIAWQESQAKAEDDHEVNDIDSIFTNKFATFKIDEEGGEADGDGDLGSEVEAEVSSQTRNRSRKKKSKKGARGRRSRTKGKKVIPEEPSSEDIPFESYRVIDAGDEDIMTDYLIGAYALVKEWTDLRAYIQGLWQEVAYEGLNSVIAAALTNMAIAMVKRTAALIAIDFPGPHDTYKTVVNTVTRGDPEKAHLSTVLSLFVQANGSGSLDQEVDAKEQLLLHTYQDFLDFICDFQKNLNQKDLSGKNLSGKPTKAMQKDLGNWDPNADLKRLSKEERLQWRRRFTINWLYDFVNVFTYLPVMQNKTENKNHDLSQIDWSSSGPFWNEQTLWGLKDFAADIAHWVYQPEGTDNSSKILPHHVFELSCIVDSLTVSRGWSISLRGRHVLDDGGPAKHFSSTRDIHPLTDPEPDDDSINRGYLIAIRGLIVWLSDADEHSRQEPHNKNIICLLEVFKIMLGRTLGVVGASVGKDTGHQTRFSTAMDGDSWTGLWKYSPFLCGAGLMEALEIGYRVSMKLWEATPEPFLTIHLYNMLLEEGYLGEEYKSELYLFTTLQDLFAEAWFVDGKAPTCNFCQALKARQEKIMARTVDPARHSQGRYNHQMAGDFQQTGLDLRLNCLFYAKSHLILYREADWNPERIEADLHLPSAMGLLRIGHTKTLIDPVTGLRRLEDTKLVKEARALGISESALVALTDVFRGLKVIENKEGEHCMASAARNMVPGLLKDSDGGHFLTRLNKRTGGGKYELQGTNLLSMIRQDIEEDVVGTRPRSGINYMWITIQMMLLWNTMEKKLKAARNDLYIRSYGGALPRRELRRVALTNLALGERDDECLTVMAESFKEYNLAFGAFFFWGNNRSTASRFKWGIGV